MRWGTLALVLAACGDSSAPAAHCGAAQTPVAIVSGVAPVALALDGADLFVTSQKPGSNQFSVLRVATGGGMPQMIADQSGITTTGGLCIDASSVYWSRGGDLVAWPKTGGAPSTLATVQGAVAGCASDGTNVYFIANTVATGGTAGFLARVTAGGSPDMLANLTAPSAMTLDGHTVFVGTIGSGVGTASVLRIDPGAAPVEISKATFVQSIGTDATDVYWTDAESGSAGSVKHAPKSGGPVTTVVSSHRCS